MCLQVSFSNHCAITTNGSRTYPSIHHPEGIKSKNEPIYRHCQAQVDTVQMTTTKTVWYQPANDIIDEKKNTVKKKKQNTTSFIHSVPRLLQTLRDKQQQSYKNHHHHHYHQPSCSQSTLAVCGKNNNNNVAGYNDIDSHLTTATKQNETK